MTQGRDEQFAVDIKGQWRLIFVVANDPIPRKADKGIDRARVTEIFVTESSEHYK